MILYENTIEKFNEDILLNRIADRASEKYKAHYGRNPGDSEYRSWAISLAILNNSFNYANLKDNHVLVEYELPYSSQRIDVVLFGSDANGKDNVVILELKQWSNDNVTLSKSAGNVVVDYGRFKQERPHPSLQVQGYYFLLKDFVKIFSDPDAPLLSASTYAHNYSKQENALLLSDQFKEEITKFPIYTKEESLELATYLRDRLGGGKGQLIYERFTGSPICPSKKLLEHTSEMINNQQIFNLVDEQIAAYNTIMHKAKTLAKTKEKSIVIVKGGPGTGKSVIALEVMGELMRKGHNVVHATGSSAFTNTLRKIVGPRARSLFKYFNSFIGVKPNTFDVLVCDEAHRIRETSMNRYTPKSLKTDLPQIDELLSVAKLGLYFIDEYQVVRPNEIGSVALIKETAHRFGIKDENIAEYELNTQFRCSGSDAYLQWLDKILDIRETHVDGFDTRMEFKIFDDPSVMMNEIRKRNTEKPNSARITAGFCWPWSKPNIDGLLVNDVKIGDFEMSWEKKDEFWKWATDVSGMEQVGTVYTAQGFEFDYIGVIFGNDLVYDLVQDKWIAKPQNSHDTAIIRGNSKLADHLKHVYRVLLSRAHKGVYVYFMDKETEQYFKSNLV